MPATPLSASTVQALYPSSSAQGQMDKRQWEAVGKQKGALRPVQGTRTVRTRT